MSLELEPVALEWQKWEATQAGMKGLWCVTATREIPTEWSPIVILAQAENEADGTVRGFLNLAYREQEFSTDWQQYPDLTTAKADLAQRVAALVWALGVRNE